MVVLSDESEEPPSVGEAGASKVRRIEADLRRRIATNSLAAGTMLPSRQVLAREYGVALATLERAVATLLAEGLLRADNGRGTFVGEDPALTRHAIAGKTIGLIAPTAYDFRIRILVEQIEREYSRAGAVTRFISRTPDEGAAGHIRGDRASVPLREAIERMLPETDALLLVSYYDDLAEVADATADLSMAHVAITAGALPPDHPTTRVFLDNRETGRLAARYLSTVCSGEEPIWMVAPITDFWVEERSGGAEEVLGERLRHIVGPEGSQANARRVSDHREAGRHAVEAVLERGELSLEGYPCFIGVSDHTAYGIMDALGDRDKRAGKDYALMGIGDSAQSRNLGLTTLRPPLEEIAHSAARLLRERLRGVRVEREVRLYPYLVRRATTPNERTV